MPTNKDAEVRYRIIDRCLSDRLRKYTIYDLVDEVNRQLLDLQGKTVSKPPSAWMYFFLISPNGPSR